MVADWSDRVTLSGEWHQGARPRYRLTLSNRSDQALTGFTLGFSGPGRITDTMQVVGGRLVKYLASYGELAPPDRFVLEPGADWVVDLQDFAFPIRHWTDGATSSFLAMADGSVRAINTTPTSLAHSDAPRKRGTMRFPLPDKPPVAISVIPWPETVGVSGRLTAAPGLSLSASDPAARSAVAAFEKLTERLFPGEGLVRPLHEGGHPVELIAGSVGPEEYALDFAPGGVRLTASTHTGFLYGLVTVGQILRGARADLRQLSFPSAGRIEDAPAYGWRGCHLDVSRQFYSSDDVGRFLALMAWNKLNVFHWHLSDDEAWRVEIDAYPQLTQKGAWRGYNLTVTPLLGSGPEPAGGYYTKHDIRTLVALAAEFGIDVVPEIDVPGHCYAMVEALPQLKDPGENGTYYSGQGFPNNSLNPAVEGVYSALETIFGEILDLFPSRYFHVGADEVPEDAWQTSPAAKALATSLGEAGAAPLQAHFLRRIQAFLTAHGRVTGAWEEASHGGGIDKANCYLVGWRDTAISQRLASEGYDVVVAPGQAFYLDMANGEAWHEAGASWAGWSSPEKAYTFDPVAGWSDAERSRLMGVQACIWSEPMTNRAVFDRLVFPRLSAVAENAWSTNRDFARFSALVGTMPNMYGNYEDA